MLKFEVNENNPINNEGNNTPQQNSKIVVKGCLYMLVIAIILCIGIIKGCQYTIDKVEEDRYERLNRGYQVAHPDRVLPRE